MRPSIVLLFLSALVNAKEFSGTVENYVNGLPISGAIILSDDSTIFAVTSRDGKFRVAALESNQYVITVSASGFVSLTTLIDLEANKNISAFYQLKPIREGTATEEFMEQEPRYRLNEVTITTTRATSEHPVTFSNITKEELDKSNYAQDLPLLFSEQPNLNTYSDGGNGFGYSYLRMRGFSQNRVAVQLNGVPLNDAESHEVFWIDLPDFAEDTEDIQIQRGVGSSLYGAAAFGGSINLVTKTPGTGMNPRIRAEGMYGSWNTRRASLLFESGRVKGMYGFNGRISRIESDGYRFGSWLKTWSYYLSAAWFSSSHTTQLVFYGGPEETHLAYYGVTRDYLNGDVTGDKDLDRRYNPLTHPAEIDHFFQPHYELHDDWKLSDKLSLENTFYIFRGDGYYDQWQVEQNLGQYFYDSPGADTTTADLLRRRNIAETDGGWIPRLNIEHKYGVTTIGAETRLHNARHEGIILWSNPIPADADANQHYYDYKVNKQSCSGFVHNLFNVTDRVNVMADLQVRSHQYKMSDDQFFGVTLKKGFTSASPRLGLNYRMIEPNPDRNIPLGIIYANLSWAQREPAFRDLYNAQDYYSSPLIAPNRFANGTAGGEYIGPSLTPEKLMNFELGTHWQWRSGGLGVNYYYIELKDAIVTDNGQLDDLGNLLSANADEVLHTGVEFVGEFRPAGFLIFSGNLAVTDHHFVKYNEVDWYTFELTPRDGNRIGQDPVALGNLKADFDYKNWFGGIGLRYVGKQYTDNSQNEDTAIDAYCLVHADAGYRFKNLPEGIPLLELRLRANNLLNVEYESVGYADAYIVGAPQSFYATVAVEL